MKTLGRPTKYKPEYCEKLIKHMSKGYSFESFAATIGVNRDTLYEWEHKHKIFSDAKKNARELSLLFWEKILKGGITGQIKNFQAAPLIFLLKNRFNWKDNPQPTPDNEKDYPEVK